MNFDDAMRGLGRPRSTSEALGSIKASGAGASHRLAAQLGVSLRQAQRYLKGEVKKVPPAKEQAIRNGADRRYIAAQAIGNAQTVSVGKVTVTDSGGKSSSRSIGTLAVDATMRAQLAEVSRLYAAGDDRGAEAAMGAAIMGGYSRSKSDNRTIAPGALTPTDYPGGIDVG
jgi:hypothetical protein